MLFRKKKSPKENPAPDHAEIPGPILIRTDFRSLYKIWVYEEYVGKGITEDSAVPESEKLPGLQRNTRSAGYAARKTERPFFR